MKICLLFPYFTPHFGGVERVIAEVSERLGKLGHEVHVVTSLLPGTKKYEDAGGVRVHRVPSFLPEKVPYPIPRKFGLDVLSEIRKINPDIIVTHNVVSFYTPVAVAARRLYRKPLVLVMHTTDANYGVGVLNAILDAYYLTAGLLRSQFDLVCAPMENKLFRLSPDVIIPNGVDMKKFKAGEKKEARRKLNLPSDGKIVLFVGRFIPVKGIDSLIRIINSTNNVRFVLVGEGYLKEKILANTKGVIMREPTEDVHLYYRAADACIIPSLAEGFSLTAVEAHACGAPIVGSNVGILPKLTGDAYSADDWTGMKDALTKVLSGESATSKDYRVDDWDEIAKKYAQTFEKILEEKGRVR
jgi:glycosyltransferase involved in cell wall biosynthesis